ncbi:MAG: S8 family peptidase [Cetobacterium sp.]|uniref:S8 family peptidase n=1 Tax=Cetobacterium sp. TaxID=2071632 RepID=UPI003F2DEE46
MENLVPIKFFGKRENDNNRTEPGGGGDLPKWVLEGNELLEKYQYTKEFIEKLKVNMIERKDQTVPITIITKLNENATAKTHRSEIVGIFENRISKNNAIGMLGDDEIILKVESLDSLNLINDKISNYTKNAYGLSGIDELNIFKPFVNKEDFDEEYKIKLINYKDYNLNTSISRKFEEYCIINNISLERKQYSNELIVYKSVKVNSKIIDEIKSLPYIYSIEPMPKFNYTVSNKSEGEKSDVALPSEDSDYIKIGVLDSGIEKINQLSPWIEGDRISPYPPNLIDTTHGTAVASIILFGDSLEGKNFTGLEGCKLIDGNVFPDTTKETITEDELIDNIREVIKEKSEDVKIWNLSGGSTDEIDDYQFSDFAIALDDIQDEYGVLICKSAGNCDNFVRNAPKKRITKSADSVRAITVGSIAHEKNTDDLVEVDYPSPFSRIGRGPSYIIKPEVVHYGGNSGIDKNGKIVTSGVQALDTNGNVTRVTGTSFSTPRVTSIIASLANEMDEEFDPLLLKALTIHSSNYGNNVNMNQSDKLLQMGYGKPKNAKEILYNDSNEITLVMRDTLSKGNFIDIMDFPFPDSLMRDGEYTGQIFATLVYNPILDGTQAAEYCQSNIDVKFGSYDYKKERDTTKNNIFNPIGRENSQNILCDSLYSKRVLKNPKNYFGLSERMLISYKDKYYPVKKYAIDLSEMTTSNKTKWLQGNKKWFLKVTGSYRNNIERVFQEKSETLSQEFCLIISIRDPKKEANIYDDVTQLLEHHNFWHNNIKLSNNISIDIND